MGLAGTVRRGGIDEGRGGMGNAKGSKAGEQSRNIPRVGDREGTVRAVMVEREAEEGGSDGVGFDVIQS